MKACVLEAVAKLIYKDVDTPKPTSGEALVKIHASGICGSDVQRVLEKGTYSFPTIPGHEFAGEVVEVGADCDKSWLNRKVTIFPLLPCKACNFCATGNFALCSNYDYYGSRRDGGFAEYLSVKEWNLVAVPDNLDYDVAALAEPCAVAVHALGRANVPIGGTIVIFGAGTIGLMMGKIAQMGGTKVILVDIDSAKLDFARNFGFNHTFNPFDTDIQNEISEYTSGCGADVCIEGTGVPAGLEGCLSAVKTFGTIVCLGNPAKDMLLTRNAYWEILRKELSLKGVWNSSYSGIKNDWNTAMQILNSQDFSPLITHRFTLSQCNKAFDMLNDSSKFCVKAMFINK